MRVVRKLVGALAHPAFRNKSLAVAQATLLVTALASCAEVPGDELGADESDQPASEAVGVAQQSLESSWTDCSAEWQRCSFTGTRTVRYGANGIYASTRDFTGGVDCRNDNFGGDPAPGVTKRCSIAGVAPPASPPPPPPSGTPGESWTRCSAEWQRCSFTGTRSVRYGANGRYAAARTFTGGVDCRNDSFGGDPAPGIAKQCDLSGAGTPPTPPTTPPTTPPVVTPPVVTPPVGGISAHVPYSRANPILYSNDHPEDVHTDVITMAMQSNGSINLRGIVTDQQTSAPGGCSGDGCHTASFDDAKRREWISAARQSGFSRVPDSLTGDAAVKLIIAEAKAATSSLPLVIMASGPLTLVAEAYRRDPSIASRVIVSIAAYVYNDSNAKYRAETNITNDKAAAQTVLEHLRCVIVPFADFNARGIDQTRYPATPRTRVNGLPSAPLRGLMLSIYAYPWAHYDADGGPQATLLSASYASASKRVRWASDTGGPYLADDAASDDIVITQVNGASVTEAWWSEVTKAFGSR